MPLQLVVAFRERWVVTLRRQVVDLGDAAKALTRNHCLLAVIFVFKILSSGKSYRYLCSFGTSNIIKESLAKCCHKEAILWK